MKIKFLKDYRYPGGGYSNKGDVRTFEDAEFAKWAIDNGFAEEVKESGWWRPKLGEEYYTLYSDGLVVSCTWDGCSVDENRFLNGMCFKTGDAAECCRDYLKAVTTVRQDEGALTPEKIVKAQISNIPEVVWCASYDEDSEPVVGRQHIGYRYPAAGGIYFDTKEHAQASLDNHPDEWKIIANYDWSRG